MKHRAEGWLLLTAVLVAYDVYLLGWRLAEVQGNVEAQFVIITPAFVISHVLRRRRADAQHGELMAAHATAAAAVEEHRNEMAATIARVRELHEFQLHMRLPERPVQDPPSTPPPGGN